MEKDIQIPVVDDHQLQMGCGRYFSFAFTWVKYYYPVLRFVPQESPKESTLLIDLRISPYLCTTDYL